MLPSPSPPPPMPPSMPVPALAVLLPPAPPLPLLQPRIAPLVSCGGSACDSPAANFLDSVLHLLLQRPQLSGKHNRGCGHARQKLLSEMIPCPAPAGTKSWQPCRLNRRSACCAPSSNSARPERVLRPCSRCRQRALRQRRQPPRLRPLSLRAVLGGRACWRVDEELSLGLACNQDACCIQAGAALMNVVCALVCSARLLVCSSRCNPLMSQQPHRLWAGRWAGSSDAQHQMTWLRAAPVG